MKLAPVFTPSALSPLLLVGIVACGGGAPPSTPTTPTKPTDAKPVAVSVDLSPVPEPANLLVIGRLQKPDAVLKTVSGWASFPLPNAAELVRSVSDEAVGGAVDLSQPIDGAVILGGSKQSPQVYGAFAVAVTSLEDAKTKLGAKHRLTPAPNGSFIVEGIGKPDIPMEKGRRDEDEEEGVTCTLAPATTGAKLVCGEKKALESLVPYLTRTMPKQSWSSDLHVELRVAPLRASAQLLKAFAPMLLGSRGAPPSVRALADAGAAELADIANDTNRVIIDSQLGDQAASATVKVEYQSTNSTFAKLATNHPERADAPPAAFYHLPADTDLALYARGSDPQLMNRPRELLGNVLLDVTEGAQMPEAERKTLRELIVDRTSTLFTGAVVYGKGFDTAALEKALDKMKSAKRGDELAEDEAKNAVAEQVIGWHLVQVAEPVSKVGGTLKDWAALMTRPGFKKWVKDNTSVKMQAQVRIAANPAGLPKDAVHLEITIPRADLESMPAVPPTPPGGKAPPPPKAKKIPLKPIVFHVLAVPDQGATWLAFGMDAKLLAARAASALSAAPEKDTLAKSPLADAVRDSKANGAMLFTLRGMLVVTAMKGRDRGPYATLAGLPHKGTTPIPFTVAAQGPSGTTPGGASVTTFKVPRAVIEDAVKLAFSQR